MERGYEEIAIEEVRNVCKTSLDTLQRVASEASEISKDILSEDELIAFIESQVDVANCKILLQHIGKMCYGNVLGNVRNMDEWKECMVDYLDVLFEDKDKMNTVIQNIYDKGIENLTPEKVDPEDEEEDLCNAQFSLAY